MRRAAAAMLGMGVLAACNLVTGVSDLQVGAVEAGVVEEPDAEPTPLPAPKRDAGGPTDAGSDVVVDAMEAAAPSSVTMAIASSPNSVNLTNEGTIDWIEWGEDGTIVPSRKVQPAGTANDIEDVVITGASTAVMTQSDDSFKPAEIWNNGTPHAVDNGNHEAGFAYITTAAIADVDLALDFKVKSSPTPRSFALYVSTVRVKASVEATFGDGRAVAAAQTIDAPPGNAQFSRILFTFSSADAATLQVKYKITQRYEASANARLGFHCASLF